MLYFSCRSGIIKKDLFGLWTLIQPGIIETPMLKAKILVIDDEEDLRGTFESFLLKEGYEVAAVENYEKAVSIISHTKFDLVFSDILLGDKTGIDILQEIWKKGLNTPVIMVTGHPSLDTASDALRLGAFDYIAKPVTRKTLLHIANKALQHKALLDENSRYRSNIEAIFRSVSDAIITFDNDMKVLEVNAAAQNICGLSRECLGKSFREVTAPCGGKCADMARESMKRKERIEVQHVECLHIERDRKRMVLHITTSPLLDNEGSPYGSVMVVRDESRLDELERDMKERRQFHNIIGKNEVMQKIYATIEDLADIQTTVLITGESGTGKELIAEALHYNGARGDKPLVKVNCSALSENLLESELFGHVRGAFTGAVKDKLGRFQAADGGTIFLDEIGDISPEVQLRLLRVLQERTFERVGDSTPVKVDVRIIAATNRDLQKEISLGRFREDLLYRLKVFVIKLPPLRERTEDIPLLAEHFMLKHSRRLNKNVRAISEDVGKLFMDYAWPGNIRELENVLEHALIVCRQPMITMDHLPQELKATPVCEPDVNVKDNTSILDVLNKTDWNIAKASRLLGMSRPTIYKKLKGIRPG